MSSGGSRATLAAPDRDASLGRAAASALLLLTGAAHALEWALRSRDPATLAFGAAYVALGLWLRRGGTAALLFAAIVPMLGGLGGARELAREFDWPLAGFVAVDVVIVGLCLYRLVTGELLAAERLMKTHEFEGPKAAARRRGAPLTLTSWLAFGVLLAGWIVEAQAFARGFADWVPAAFPASLTAIPYAAAALATDRVRDARAARVVMLVGAIAIGVVGWLLASEFFPLSWHRGEQLLRGVLLQCAMAAAFVGVALGLRARRLERLGRAEWPL